jgi:Fe-S oxidoreductase
MQTNLADFIKDTPAGREADAILRSCVHCGFCTATCPTFQLLGDELDGPRGRIYLIKQMLEGQPVTETTQLHLDRCLSCRSCETTCPSGVRYHRLLEIGREVARAARAAFAGGAGDAFPALRSAAAQLDLQAGGARRPTAAAAAAERAGRQGADGCRGLPDRGREPAGTGGG